MLSGVNLEIENGDIKVLMGSSGCGKTTLIRCLNKLVEPTSGSIYFHGKNITVPNVDVRALRQNIGFVFQNFALYRHLSVLDNVTLGLKVLRKMCRLDAKNKAMYELSKLDMSSHSDKYPSQLSGGQKQRVALARALAMDPDVIVFDEPTSALDPIMTREVAFLINQLRNQKVTILCVTHDVALASQISDKVVFLSQGKVMAEGSLEYLSKTHPNPLIRDFFGYHQHA